MKQKPNRADLMAMNSVEDFHQNLKRLTKKEAQNLVDSMNEDEVYSKVNFRRHQNDYIGDYLEYLWELSKEAYWKHIITTLDTHIGLLWCDHMLHFEKMCTNPIPDEVFNAVLNFATNYNDEKRDDLEIIGCVVSSQARHFNRTQDIKNYILSINIDKKAIAEERINQMLIRTCKYGF